MDYPGAVQSGRKKLKLDENIGRRGQDRLAHMGMTLPPFTGRLWAVPRMTSCSDFVHKRARP